MASTDIGLNYAGAQPMSAPRADPQPNPPTSLDRGLHLERGHGIVFAETRSLVAAAGQWLHEDAVGFAADDANLCRYVTLPPAATEPPGA